MLTRSRRSLSATTSRGFTLIETIVATGLFALLALTAVSIMLSVVKAQTSVQRIQSAIDNIRFSLELITKEMRVGTGYRLVSPNECGDAGTDEINFVTSFPPAERRYFIQANRLMRIKKSSAILGGRAAPPETKTRKLPSPALCRKDLKRTIPARLFP